MAYEPKKIPGYGLLPGDIVDVSEDNLKEWLTSLLRCLEDLFKMVHFDIANGTSTFQVTSTLPTATTLDEGAFIIYDDEATTRRLYTKVNGTIRYVTLT